MVPGTQGSHLSLVAALFKSSLYSLVSAIPSAFVLPFEPIFTVFRRTPLSSEVFSLAAKGPGTDLTWFAGA